MTLCYIEYRQNEVNRTYHCGDNELRFEIKVEMDLMANSKKGASGWFLGSFVSTPTVPTTHFEHSNRLTIASVKPQISVARTPLQSNGCAIVESLVVRLESWDVDARIRAGALGGGHGATDRVQVRISFSNLFVNHFQSCSFKSSITMINLNSIGNRSCSILLRCFDLIDVFQIPTFAQHRSSQRQELRFGGRRSHRWRAGADDVIDARRPVGYYCRAPRGCRQAGAQIRFFVMAFFKSIFCTVYLGTEHSKLATDGHQTDSESCICSLSCFWYGLRPSDALILGVHWTNTFGFICVWFGLYKWHPEVTGWWLRWAGAKPCQKHRYVVFQLFQWLDCENLCLLCH